MSFSDERYNAFMANFKKLQANRAKVDLQELQTGRYANAYTALVKSLQADAVWYAECYLEALTFPRHPGDSAGNRWLDKHLADIMAEEQKPGGRVERYISALIDGLDFEKYITLVWEIYDRQEREVFSAYWDRHCQWVGPPERRQIFNDIINKYWVPPKADGSPWGKDGYWVSADGTEHDLRFPPGIGYDPQDQVRLDTTAKEE